MSNLAKTLVRELIIRTPYLKEKYAEWEFLRREQSFKGIYSSFAEAAAHYPSGRLPGYNHQQIARVCEKTVEQLNQNDYPILFWMSDLVSETQTVFDLGGNIGSAYYAYGKHLAFPANLRWTVCEVPETASAGREIAETKKLRQLHFTDRRDEADDADIYFTAGALQYIEEPFAEILARLPSKPRHVLINRVPLCEDRPFITLQNNGAWVCPYKVDNRTDFIRSILELGYELVDKWEITRSFRVQMSPWNCVDHYHGMYFRMPPDLFCRKGKILPGKASREDRSRKKISWEDDLATDTAQSGTDALAPL